MKIRAIAIASALTLIAVIQAPALDLINSRGEGMGQTVIISQSTPTELIRVPTGGLAAGEWRVETGYDRLYGMSDLSQFFVAGAYRYNNITSAGGISSFGNSDLYTELTGKFQLAYHRDSLTFGLNFSGMLVQFGGEYQDLSQSTFGFGGSYRSDMLLVAVTGDNLTSPVLHDDAVKTDKNYSFYSEFRGKRSFSICGRATFESDQKLQLAIGQRIFISSQSAVFWGLSTEPLKYGGGLELGWDKSTLSYALSNHPVLGFTHTLSISYGVGRKITGRGDDFK